MSCPCDLLHNWEFASLLTFLGLTCSHPLAIISLSLPMTVAILFTHLFCFLENIVHVDF